MGGDVSREVAEEVVDLARLGVGGEASDKEGAELVPLRGGLLRAVVVGAVSGGGSRRREAAQAGGADGGRWASTDGGSSRGAPAEGVVGSDGSGKKE
jgi:hypothetical protein